MERTKILYLIFPLLFEISANAISISPALARQLAQTARMQLQTSSIKDAALYSGAIVGAWTLIRGIFSLLRGKRVASVEVQSDAPAYVDVEVGTDVEHVEAAVGADNEILQPVQDQVFADDIERAIYESLQDAHGAFEFPGQVNLQQEEAGPAEAQPARFNPQRPTRWQRAYAARLAQRGH